MLSGSFRPTTGAVEDGEYLNGGGLQPVGDDVGRSCHNQFASAGDSSDAAFSRKQTEAVDRFENQTKLPVRCGQAVFGDISMQLHRFRRRQQRPLDLCGQMQSEALSPFSQFPRGWLHERRKAPTHLIVRCKFTGVGLTYTFFDQGDVVLVQSEVLIDGFVEDEAAVALLERGEGIEGFDLVAGGAEGDCLLLHALIIHCITREYQSSIRRTTHPSGARMAHPASVVLVLTT
jgi:hypothetical protein